MKRYIAQTKKMDYSDIKWDTFSSNYRIVTKHNIGNNDLDHGLDTNINNNEYNDLIDGKLDPKEVILIEKSLLEVGADIINKHGYEIFALKQQKSEIIALQHPIMANLLCFVLTMRR